jgi:hypothetical protein
MDVVRTRGAKNFSFDFWGNRREAGAPARKGR